MLRALRPNPQRQRTSTGASIPAPVAGWDAISPLADMKEDRAVVLDNWFPQPGYIEVRRGHQIHAGQIGTGAIETLMAYNGLTTSSDKLFAVGNSGIYDVTSSGAVGAASVASLSNNRFQYVNFTNASGTHYLWSCNGANSPQIWNGSVWSNPTITGITSSDIINVAVHKNRLWFCLVGSMSAAYLTTDAIQGAATKFPLGTIMDKGGYLVSIGTWTHDAGSGPDDYIVFMSSRGQAVVYQGGDPSDVTDWFLVGVYEMGAALGYRCLTKVAGDLAFIGIDGILPFSTGKSQERSAAGRVAITQNITNAMNVAARSYGSNFGWELISYPKGTRAILNVPITEGELQHQYVMNTLTGAWCRFTNQNANTWRVFRDNLYFGGNDGFVYRADNTALDLTEPVDAVAQTAYNYFRQKGKLKQFKLLQPLITTDSSSVPSMGISTDFKDNATLGTPTSASSLAALYDSAVWDVDVYPIEARNISNWNSANGIGQCASVHIRSRTGRDAGVSLWGVSDWGTDEWSYSISGDVIMQLNGFNITYEPGEFL
jgi:hypothetical protein